MKLGAFIVVSLYAATAVADPRSNASSGSAGTRSAPGGSAQSIETASSGSAGTRSAPGGSAQSIETLRKQYELDSDPALLVQIAHEYRKHGNVREALAYYCSYMYIDAAGPLADEASANARAISAELGNPTQSDHQACSPRPPASREKPAPTLTVDLAAYTSVQPTVPRIYKREIVGLAGLGASLAFLGLSLYEGREIKSLRAEQRTNDPRVDVDALAARQSSAELRQKVFLAAGGAVMLTGGILYVTGRIARKKAEDALIAPTLLKGGAGVSVGRRF